MTSSPSWSLPDAIAEICDGGPDPRLLARLLDRVAEEIDCERVFLFQLRPRGGFRVLLSRTRDREPVPRASSRISHYAVRKVVETGKPVVVADARKDRRYRPEEVLEGRKGPESILVMPVRAEGEVLGGVYADHRFRAIEARRVAAASAWVDLLGLALRLRAVGRGRRGVRPVPVPAEPRERAGEAASSGETRVETFHGFLSANPDLLDVFDTLRNLERSSLPVVIHGETGVGKSLLAAAVHRSSSRREGPFYAVLPSAVPEDLIESELLGHVQGAFTGAEVDRPGAFVLADGGTILLEEIADMSDEFQKKLLRVLEDGQVRPLGAKATTHVDVRLVACTSTDPEILVRRGTLREDVFYRLKGVVIEIPPLRERSEDVLPLAEHFLTLHAGKDGRPRPDLAESARPHLLRYAWPGNARELENEMRRLVALGTDRLDEAHLAPFLRGRSRGAARAGVTLVETVGQAERDAILDALRLARGNKSQAAEALGVTRKTLYRRMVRYGLRR